MYGFGSYSGLSMLAMINLTPQWGEPSSAGIDRNHVVRPAAKRPFTTTLTKIFAECRRVLRPQGSLVFTFHHKSVDAWESLGTALLKAGFTIDEVIPVRSEGQSGFHSYEGTIKWDSIFFCRPCITVQAPLASSSDVPSAVLRAATAAHLWSGRIRKSKFEFPWQINPVSPCP